MNSISEWEKLFATTFERVKQTLSERYPLEEDGSGSPNFVAIRKAIDQLPCAVKILQLELDKSKHNHLKDDLCPMIHYDFNRMNDFSVKNLGNVIPSDNKFLDILQNEFHIKNVESFVQDFLQEYKIMALIEDDEDLSGNFQFLFYDPRNNPEMFVRDLVMLFEFNFIPYVARKIEVVPDYNKQYGLQPDPILSESELLTKHVGMDSFVVSEGNKTRKFEMEDFQKHVAKIQLIPSVNEHVKNVFDRAKKLYIFGWYVYGFFPIAEHYATLALESAIKHRYFQHFGNQITIRNEDGKTETMQNADYSRITELHTFRKKEGWNIRKLMVNNERFLYIMNDLLDWCVKNKIITKWERKRCEYKIDTRNYLSHPTFSPSYPAGKAFKTIEEVAYLINKMFSSLETDVM